MQALRKIADQPKSKIASFLKIAISRELKDANGVSYFTVGRFLRVSVVGNHCQTYKDVAAP
jgi:hypothetical protein